MLRLHDREHSMARAFRRIIAFGDLHAEAGFFREVMSRCGLVDDANQFIARDTALILLGNICDRGPDSAGIYRSVMSYQAQAPKRGSRVYSLLGKHEVTHLFGMHMEMSETEQAGYRFDGYSERDACERAFAPGGWLFEWLVTQPVAVRIHPFIFAPADLPPVFRDLQVADVNTAVRTELQKHVIVFRNGTDDLPLSLFSPEASILCSDAAGHMASPDYTSTLHTFLRNNRAHVYVCGHTPQASGTFSVRHESRYVCIDTGLSFVEQGFGSRTVFEWTDDAVYEVTFTGSGTIRKPVPLPLDRPV